MDLRCRHDRLDRHHRVVECTLTWFARFRQLAVSYERLTDILEGFHYLAAALICLSFAERWSC
jgi:transposase